MKFLTLGQKFFHYEIANSAFFLKEGYFGHPKTSALLLNNEINPIKFITQSE